MQYRELNPHRADHQQSDRRLLATFLEGSVVEVMKDLKWEKDSSPGEMRLIFVVKSDKRKKELLKGAITEAVRRSLARLNMGFQLDRHSSSKTK